MSYHPRECLGQDCLGCRTNSAAEDQSPLGKSEKVPRREEGLVVSDTWPRCRQRAGWGPVPFTRPEVGEAMGHSVAFEAFLPLPSPSLSRPPRTLSVCSTQPGLGERWCWPPEPVLGLGLWPISSELHGVPGSRGLSSLPSALRSVPAVPASRRPWLSALRPGVGLVCLWSSQTWHTVGSGHSCKMGFLSPQHKRGSSFLDRAVERLPCCVWKLQAPKTL